MHQRTIVLGEELREGNGDRMMHQLLLLSAVDIKLQAEDLRGCVR